MMNSMKTPQEIAEMISKRFYPLPNADLDSLASIIESSKAAKGELLVDNGQISKYLYYVEMCIRDRENTNVLLSGTSKVKFPSKSEAVPFVVPFTTILTPIRGSPFWSFTTPLMVELCCAI